MFASGCFKTSCLPFMTVRWDNVDFGRICGGKERDSETTAHVGRITKMVGYVRIVFVGLITINQIYHSRWFKSHSSPGVNKIWTGSDRIGSDWQNQDRIGPDWQNLDRIASDWQNPDRIRKKSDCPKFPLKIVTWYLNQRWRRKKCDVALILQEWLRALVITKMMKENMLY